MWKVFLCLPFGCMSFIHDGCGVWCHVCYCIAVMSWTLYICSICPVVGIILPLTLMTISFSCFSRRLLWRVVMIVGKSILLCNLFRTFMVGVLCLIILYIYIYILNFILCVALCLVTWFHLYLVSPLRTVLYICSLFFLFFIFLNLLFIEFK